MLKCVKGTFVFYEWRKHNYPRGGPGACSSGKILQNYAQIYQIEVLSGTTVKVIFVLNSSTVVTKIHKKLLSACVFTRTTDTLQLRSKIFKELIN